MSDVLGLLVERAAGQRLDRVLGERILGPLGMRDTAFFVAPERRSRVAEAPDSDPRKADMWRSYRIFEDQAGTSYLKGGAGLVSTSADYFRFAQMLGSGGSSRIHTRMLFKNLVYGAMVESARGPV